MNLSKRLLVLPVLLAGALAVGPNAQADTRHDPSSMHGRDEECRAGTYNPIVGIWDGHLDFQLLGKATVIVSINQGGTFTETDSVDLNTTVGNTSPGYAAWAAKDCRHYTLTIHKMLFDPKSGQFSKVILPGTIVLSEDGQSWTVDLKQEIYNQAGQLAATGTVTGVAQRVKAGSAD
ncbi:hypothetical protein SNE35_26605 [Paucibacter sp. R3-3]|uniref:Uncharacterized protein n=1 Tax=Roseateles agri TaxID=3098619 RepID=A0ABU5DP58_9BURK|nr:hypothetical protein [Paucibacter sp. R3-3]MDY0748100.1 hypothetical protein [Paucibacter sp. R3-3]